jgi:hypothetical protein
MEVEVLPLVQVPEQEPLAALALATWLSSWQFWDSLLAIPVPMFHFFWICTTTACWAILSNDRIDFNHRYNRCEAEA